MTMEIIGRTGAKTYAWAMDSQGRGQIAASSDTEDRHINKGRGKVWYIESGRGCCKCRNNCSLVPDYQSSLLYND